MTRCCGESGCPCKVSGGDNITVTGKGTAVSPFIVSAPGAATTEELAVLESSRYDWEVPLFPSWWYSGVCYRNPGSTIPAEATMIGSRFVAGRDATLDRIAIGVTVVGTAGAVIRLGIYSLNVETGTITLVLDAGTVSGTAVADAELTISQAVTKGTNYFLMAAVQGGAGTRPTLRTNEGFDPWIGHTASWRASQDSFIGVAVTGVSGALPSSVALASLDPVNTGQSPRVLVRTS